MCVVVMHPVASVSGVSANKHASLTKTTGVQLVDHWAWKLDALQSMALLHGDAEAVVSERRRVGEGRGASTLLHLRAVFYEIR